MTVQLWRRSRVLIAEVLDALPADGEGVRLPEVMELGLSFLDDEGAQRWSEKTVRNTIADLEAFGAVSVTGPRRDRRVRVTMLGLAWQAGRVLPPPVGLSDLAEVQADLLEWFDEA